MKVGLNRDTSTVHDLSQKIFEQTRIPPARQMLMIPGLKVSKAQLVNGEKILLSSVGTLKEAMTGTLFGTPIGDEFSATPATTAQSDQNENQSMEEEQPEEILPAGYVNLGNTCYLGSILAMLESAQEFRNAIEEMPRQGSIAGAWSSLWRNKQQTKAATPVSLFTELIQMNPEFGERKPGSLHPQMQDAEECLAKLFAALPETRWRDLFRFSMVETSELHEQYDETIRATHSKDCSVADAMKISCYLGTAQKPISTMSAGIALALEDEIEKRSESTGQNMVFNRQRRIDSLPPYLIVHMVRFEWKKANALAGSKAGRAKILKRIEYPKEMDVYEFCSDQLKGKLMTGRLAEKARRDAEVEALSKSIEKAPAASDEPFKKEIADGTFSLKAVVTHMGRGASEGHYICWLWRGNHWVKLDDSKSSLVEENAVDLQGGLADGHCPYILFYQRNGTVSENAVPAASEGPNDPVESSSKE